MIRPLTKKDQHGKLYTRPLEIQTAINAAIQQDIGHVAAARCGIETGLSRFYPLGMFGSHNSRS